MALDLHPVNDSRQLRRVLGNFATGIIVVTTIDEHGGPVGITINSFNSVSLDPALVLWSVSNTSGSASSFLTLPVLHQYSCRIPNRFAQLLLQRPGRTVSGCGLRAGAPGLAGTERMSDQPGLQYPQPLPRGRPHDSRGRGRIRTGIGKTPVAVFSGPVRCAACRFRGEVRGIEPVNAVI